MNTLFMKTPWSFKIPLLSIIFVITIIGCTDFFSEPKSKQQPASETRKGPPVSGKVIKAIRGGGYTYMELENGGKKFWIASSIINVKRNDTVSWESGTVMTDFTSFALNKKFQEIRFVKSIKIEY